jgi:hypothetical protein
MLIFKVDYFFSEMELPQVDLVVKSTASVRDKLKKRREALGSILSGISAATTPATTSGPNVITLFFSTPLTKRQNKLECIPPSSFSGPHVIKLFAFVIYEFS